MHLASESLKGICKFGYIDLEKGIQIVNRFGISGFGVTIFLNSNKPPPHGAPSMVNGGSVIDYEKQAWETIGTQLLPEENFSPKVEDLVGYNIEHGIMQRDDQAFFILFYSNARNY